jgi:predicted RNA-binding protein associated with RNAse of E/G family
VLERDATHVILEARFNRDDLDLGYATFRRGDRFVEHFYTDRWYNIFEVHDVDDDHLKGWYCNVVRPAILTDGQVRADDLALDVFIYPDGRSLVMDEDEFRALPLTQAERDKAWAAVAELKRRASQAEPPFEAIK